MESMQDRLACLPLVIRLLAFKKIEIKNNNRAKRVQIKQNSNNSPPVFTLNSLSYSFAILALISCNESTKIETVTEEEITEQDLDLDGDGYLASEECDDTNILINPSVVELCDGVDNNCDGQIDEGVTTDYFLDIDLDNFGDSNVFVSACDPPDGYVAIGNDCDDSNPEIFPAAMETCNEIDDDCDGEIDEDLVLGTYYDGDGDGHGDPNMPSTSCHDEEGYVFYNDDCDDSNPEIRPYQQELCNEIDDDCDGEIDEGANQYYYADADSDGFGDPFTAVQSCERPQNYVENDLDCDDLDQNQNPNADEYCNQEDDDCDGQTDEDSVDAPIWYYDIDGDGFGSGFITSSECSAPSGYFAVNDDCDDTRSSVYPGATEYCNELDDDCSGVIDDNAVDALYWFSDYDNDDFGDPNNSQYQCSQPFDFILNNMDCDDSNGDVNPDAIEVCNDLDDDCNNLVDDSALDAINYYLDSDIDGFGDPNQIAIACDPPAGYLLDNTDCDDSDDSIYPNAQEYCDGIDQNCNGNNFYELDLDSNNLLACEESIWIRNSASNATSPNGACSQAAGHLLNEGVTIHDTYHGNTVITSGLLENFGLYVHHGNNMNGALGAYTNSEATAIEDWVYNGGRMLFIGYHSTEEACESSNSIPYQFGVSCDSVYHSWGGTTSTFVPHPITDGLNLVGGLGGENWVVTAPAQVLASVGQYEFIVVVEHGEGKVVLISDEWPYYNPRGGHSISYGDNEQMVQNVWNWLLE